MARHHKLHLRKTPNPFRRQPLRGKLRIPTLRFELKKEEGDFIA